MAIRTLLFSPTGAVRRLAAHPSPLAWLAGTGLVIVAARVALLATAIGQQAFVDQWVQRAEAFGIAIDDAAFARLDAWSGSAPLYGAAVGLALGLLLPVVTALLLKWVGRQQATWAAAFTLAGYVNLPLALRELIALPAGYARETLTSPLTLGTLFPMLDEASPAARFLWSVDVFVLWWLVIVAIAAAALSDRRAAPIAATLAGVYALAGLLMAGAMVVAGGA